MLREIINNLFFTLTITSIFCGLTGSAKGQTITGKVTDSMTDLPLIGANVLVLGAAIGSATDTEGDFEIYNLAPGTYTLRVSFIGYAAEESLISLSEGQQFVWNVALVPGTNLDPVQVTAGRRSEKVLDAPIAIDVVTVRDLELDVAHSTAKSLRNVAGLDMVQTGVDRYEIVLRGFNNAFSRSTYVLTDYRNAGAASIGVNLHNIMPALTIDTDRVEIVRGPGSALYGPGVGSGVIHYISKDPFNHPGVTVSVSGGQQSMFNFQGRAATVLGKNLGIKFVANYATAEDFALQDCDPALLKAQKFQECPDPEDAAQIFVDGLRETQHGKLMMAGMIDWRIRNQTVLSLNGGIGKLNGTVLSGIGTIQSQNMALGYGQLRLQSGPLFVQAYVNATNSGDSYIYNGDPVVEFSREYALQAQYAKLIGSRQELIAGADLTLTRPDTRGTVLGRNEEKDNIDEFGVYLQSISKISKKLELTFALRGDYNSVMDEIQMSPRIAFVLKPTPSSSLRTTYNRSFGSPDASGYFLDLVASSLEGLNVRARGGSTGFTYRRDPNYLSIGAPTDLVASSMLPGIEGQPTPVGLHTGFLYGLMYEGLAAIPDADLASMFAEIGLNIPAALIPSLKLGLSPEVTTVEGFSPGVLGLLNLSTQTLVTGPELNRLPDQAPIKSTISQSWEIGYRGILREKVLFELEGYYTRRKNFIGSLQIRTPFVLVPNLKEHLIRDISAGLTANTDIANALGLFGLTPAEAAEQLVNIAGSDLPDAETPIAIVQPNENNRGAGQFPELMLTYPNFGNIKYFGMDISTQVIASDQMTIFGNASWVSDDYFDHTEINEESEDLELALNAPRFKFKLGGQYRSQRGLSVMASGRFTNGFPVNSGQYVGNVESYTVLDLGIGYAFRKVGVRADLGIHNLLGSDHREFVGAPRLGRIANIRLTYTTDRGR